MDDPNQEILDRLTALERRIDSLERAGPRCSFHEEERRVVDTIVRLTTESIVREMEARMSRASREEVPRHHGPPPPHEDRPPRDGGRGPALG